MLQKMERFIFFALFTCLDCVSANNQCEANSMGDDCRVIEFKEGTKNKILKNHVIRTDQVQDKDICELRCYLEPNCVSYNYGPREGGTFTCELNNMTHSQVFDSFEDKSGFLYTEIFNPCESNLCANHATCQAWFGDHGYRCLCPAGYQEVQCETDIDECNDGSHDCPTIAICTNTGGSFDCSCKSGHQGDGRSFCSDIDECNDHNPPCDENAHCGNTDGSFTCSCKDGYSGNGHLCTDVDECTLGEYNCPAENECINTRGSYQCSECKLGYTDDGNICQDNWKTINVNPVCFGTKDDDHGAFSFQEAGHIYTFKLVHTSGSVTCENRTTHRSTKWGCFFPYGYRSLMTVITYSNKTLLPFTEFKKGSENNYYSYKIDGVDANSLSLEYNLLPNPLVVSVGQQLQIWFWQDLVNFTEENNFGKTCTDVYALYP